MWHQKENDLETHTVSTNSQHFKLYGRLKTKGASTETQPLPVSVTQEGPWTAPTQSHSTGLKRGKGTL